MAEGKRLLKARQYAGAKAQLEKCLQLNPKSCACHSALGTAYLKLKDTRRAQRELREFLRCAPPDDPEVEQVKALLSPRGKKR